MLDFVQSFFSCSVFPLLTLKWQIMKMAQWNDKKYFKNLQTEVHGIAPSLIIEKHDTGTNSLKLLFS